MTGRMKLGIGVAILAGLAALALWRIEAASSAVLTARYPKPASPLAVAPDPSMAKTGERLAKLNGCTDCHGDALTGHVEFTAAFGTRLVAPNLTRLAHHLSADQLAAAIRFGIRPNGTSLINMPTGRFLRSSDQDVAAIIAYLQSLPEKPDATGKTKWGVIGRAMLAMGLMRVEAPLTNPAMRGPAETPTTPLALGRYVAQAQCSGCHGPQLSGNPDEDSPDLRKAVKKYTAAQFVTFFATGNAHQGHPTHDMTRVIKDQLKYLTRNDVRSLYTYLKTTGRAATPATP